ncbi:MAG: thioredoxin domain-containing protein [Reyranellaceae bacterium]
MASSSPPNAANRLAGETSPYLLQHADNPVAWWPWGEAALEEARRSKRPILLSVGYAACHWCHVMAHESFEDEATAAVMNELFVNIKVDREERPDIDQIYQQALALLGEQGGWPLTMFLTEDGEPFWGGTYFPNEQRYGRPAFVEVLRTVARVHKEEPEKIGNNVTALKEALAKMSSPQAGGGIAAETLDQIAERLLREIDMVHGGFGSAPKFPSPYIHELLWRAWLRGGRSNQRYRDAVEVTLDRMSQGGIYDHLGGGFARYSTDAFWLAPHFEKMLYDNAQLIDLLTLAWQESGSPLYRQRVEETVDWVEREMIAGGGEHARGGFAATFDADSEGEEGRFYVWSEAEIDAVLGENAELFKKHYDVSAAGNWEHANILNRNKLPGLQDASTEAKLVASRAKLKAVRDKRVWPGWDDKVLADWNGLMIAALANAGRAFGRPHWLELARDAFAFVQENMTGADGRLRHAWRQGTLKHRATLDDYANMIRAALALHEATGETAFLGQAEDWTATVDAHYLDADNGGYFFTADDAADLIVRAKNANDNAVPSGNGTMLGNLARLFLLTGQDAYRRRAEAQRQAFAGELQRNFFPLTTLLNASDFLDRAVQVVIAGEPGAADTEALADAAYSVSQPNRLMQYAPPGRSLPSLHPAQGKGMVDGRAAAYVCRDQTCSLPILAPEELRAALREA